MSPQAKHPGAGHRARLREKFLKHGLVKFTDDEVLELLLTLATPRRDCKQQARGLLAAFGSLQAVLDAEPKDLAQVKGIGPKNVLGLKLVPSVARRYLKDRLLHGGAYKNAAQAAEYLELTMRPLTKEVFRLMVLDAERQVRGVEDLSSGTLTEHVVYPREVVAKALAGGAASIVCAHNHPSGSTKPSRADRDFTRRLFYACAGVGVELLDHVIVGAGALYSFAASGELAAFAREHSELNL